MTLVLKTDPSQPGGGFALLEGVALDGVSSISIENGFSGQFLGEDGKWARNAFAFPVEPAPGGRLSLGPHIVDHVPTELQVELRTGEGRPLGKLFWTDVIPSRNPGSVTSAQVLEERRRRAQQQVAEETAALARVAARNAEEQAAKEREAMERTAFLENERAAADARASAEAEDARRRAAAAKEEDAKRPPTPILSAAAAAPVLAVAPAPSSLPRPRRRSRWPLLVLLILLPLAAVAAALTLRPDLLRLGGQSDDRGVPTPPPQVPTPAEPPAAKSEPRQEEPDPEPPKVEPTKPEPAKPEPPKPEPPKPVDCTTFSGRVAALQGKSDTQKVSLGEEALHAGCGSEAFQAFDASDPQTSEAAAWNLARFYDPNEGDPVYRGAASVHPDYAAAYYRLWRDRSPRQAQALARICEAGGGNAALRRSCGR